MDVPKYAVHNCELHHNFIAFCQHTTKGNIMSKELNVIDSLINEQSEVAASAEIIKLDDLSLALVGGGNVIVDLG